MLGQRHEVIAVTLGDPWEQELPDIGPIILEDSETGEQIYLDTHDRKFRQQFAEAGRLRAAELERTFKRHRVDLLPLSTGEDLVRSIVRFASLKKQRRR